MAIKNKDSLLRKLAALPDKARQAIKPALLQGANEIASMQRTLVPKDDQDLLQSIDVISGNVTVRASGEQSDKDVKGDPDLTVSVVAGDKKAYYAKWVEFGTPPHKAGGMFEGASHPGNKAQPFFFPAVRALKRRVKSRITRATKKAAREVAGS